jgi:hypothetical protein
MKRIRLLPVILFSVVLVYSCSNGGSNNYSIPRAGATGGAGAGSGGRQAGATDSAVIDSGGHQTDATDSTVIGTGGQRDAAGGGGPAFPLDCADAGGVDAGSPPAFCPVVSPKGEPGKLPGPGVIPTMLIVKFVEGSHVRLRGGSLTIDPRTMLDEDPGLLRCAGFTVDAARCELSALDAFLAADPDVTVVRALEMPEAWFEEQRASGRAMSGQFLADMNVYFRVTAPETKTPRLHDRLARSALVETVYYQGLVVVGP